MPTADPREREAPATPQHPDRAGAAKGGQPGARLVLRPHQSHTDHPDGATRVPLHIQMRPG